MWSSARISPAAPACTPHPIRPARAPSRQLWTPPPPRHLIHLFTTFETARPVPSLPPRCPGSDGHAEAQAEAVASRAVERGHVVTTIDPRAFGDGFFLQLMCGNFDMILYFMFHRVGPALCPWLPSTLYTSGMQRPPVVATGASPRR